MHPYAATLHHLTLTGMCGRILKLEDGISLGAFSRLRALALDNLSIGEGCLCSALGFMPLLADLSIVNVSFLSDASSLPISSHPMTRLKSFEFRLVSWHVRPVWHWIGDSARRFPQLTRVSFEFPTSAYRLPSSKTMTYLTVHMFSQMAPNQMLQMTKIMPQLEVLEMHNYGGLAFYLPSCMFLNIKGLRSLILKGVPVELDFFDALASLEHLTALRLCCRQSTEGLQSVRFYAEANRLTNLLFLNLDILDPYKKLVLKQLSGVQLSRLQVLILPRCKLDDNQKNQLFSRFPSLRRFSSD